MDPIRQCGDNDDDIKRKASSRPAVQLCETATMGEISCHTMEPFIIEDHSCEPVCNLEETRIDPLFPQPEFDYVDPSGRVHKFPDVISSNLSENEYEELLRVYREKIW